VLGWREIFVQRIRRVYRRVDRCGIPTSVLENDVGASRMFLKMQMVSEKRISDMEVTTCWQELGNVVNLVLNDDPTRAGGRP